MPAWVPVAKRGSGGKELGSGGKRRVGLPAKQKQSSERAEQEQINKQNKSKAKAKQKQEASKRGWYNDDKIRLSTNSH